MTDEDSNADSFADEIRDAKATELDRLGSQQSLVALTDADLTVEEVLRAAAQSEHAARETFGGWAENADAADSADADDSARSDDAKDAFADLAEQEANHYERVVAELDDLGAEEFTPSDALDSMHEELRNLSTTVERAAGLVGRSLVADRTQLQVVNFFVNEADRGRANLFRDLRADTRQGISTGADLLATHCDDEEDWARARETAKRIVQVAYEDYAETLEGMGLDPKPIC